MTGYSRANLLDHPLRMAASTLPLNCTVHANFRTYDPEDRTTKPLPLARVNLVSSAGVTYPGETDQNGDLCMPNSTVPLVVAGLENLPEGVEFHFEVVGPAGSSNADLTAMSYPVGNGASFFPVHAWSTRGWKEPEGHWGHFKLAGPIFPAQAACVSFTVGCYMNVAVRYFRSTTCLASPVPTNIQLSLIYGSTTKPPTTLVLALRPGGILSEIFFNINPGDKVEVEGAFKSEGIWTENITPTVGNVTAASQSIVAVPGSLFGFPVRQSVEAINLYAEYEFADSTYSALLWPPPDWAVGYASYAGGLKSHYTHLTLDQKKCVFYNWFIEFVAYRNFYVRAMNLLLGQSGLSWNGLADATLFLDDGLGGAAARQVNFVAHLETILKPREDIFPHEFTHSLLFQYVPYVVTPQYFPNYTFDHDANSWSHELFAFQEGFPEFVATLFMDPARAYKLPPNTDWTSLFTFQGGVWGVRFGWSAQFIDDDKLGPSPGMELESAFSSALAEVWRGYIWQTPTASRSGDAWVQDLVGDGSLDPAAPASPNAWLLDTGVQKRFGEFIIGAVVAAGASNESGRITGGISTRRFVHHMNNKMAANTSWPASWRNAVSATFISHGLRNEFFISYLNDIARGPKCIIVRSNNQAEEYSAIRRDTNDRADITMHQNGSNMFEFSGIKIPLQGGQSTLSCSLVSGSGGPATGFPVVGTVTVDSEFYGSVMFSMFDLANTPLGPCHMLFESDPGQPANRKLLITSVKIVT